MSTAKKTTKKRVSKVPKKVQQLFYADAGGDVNLAMAESYSLEISQMAAVTQAMNKVFNKEVPVADLPKEIQAATGLNEKQSLAYALEIAGKRFLVMDDFFNGAIAAFITDNGGTLDKYTKFIEDYKTKVAGEIAEQKRLEAEAAAALTPPKKTAVDKEILSDNTIPTDPKVVMADLLRVLKEHVVKALSFASIGLKLDLNTAAISLLLTDKSYYSEMLTALINNDELVSKKKLMIEGEKLEPTVKNWLHDFVRFVGAKEGARFDTIKKAKYLTESKNLKNASPEERVLVDHLIDLYSNLANFYEKAERYALEDIQIFPYSDAELQSFSQGMTDLIEAEQEKDAKNVDIYDVYKGDPQEAAMVLEIKERLIADTRREYNKVVDWFYDMVLKRKRLEVIAGLELMAEIGVLDNTLQDKRFQELMKAYFKHNAMQKQAELFAHDSRDPQFVKYFVKYLTMERLGMVENDAARIGAHLSSIFQEQGNDALSQLAFYDVANKKFQWF